MAVSFILNGLNQTVDLDPATPLIYVLRNEFLLHGAKLGCGLEQCGACLVLVDGQPTYACSTRLDDLHNRSIETLEGLNDEQGNLHPIQQAFMELNAAQCGYCTAGMIMCIKALLEATPDPSRREILAALDGQLCRCGAHPRILHAVERAIAIRQRQP